MRMKHQKNSVKERKDYVVIIAKTGDHVSRIGNQRMETSIAPLSDIPRIELAFPFAQNNAKKTGLLHKIELLLQKIDVEFNTYHDLDEMVSVWQLDYSLTGAVVKIIDIKLSLSIELAFPFAQNNAKKTGLLHKIELLLHKIDVEFDTYHDLDEMVSVWQLDYSLTGAVVKIME